MANYLIYHLDKGDPGDSEKAEQIFASSATKSPALDYGAALRELRLHSA